MHDFIFQGASMAYPRRRPKIYVVTEERHCTGQPFACTDCGEPYHDNSTVRFVTLDIDEAFMFAESLIPDLAHSGSAKVQISEFEGTDEPSRVWTTLIDPKDKIRYGKWVQRIAHHHYREYAHVPGDRKERLIEAAEIIMTLTVEGDA